RGLTSEGTIIGTPDFMAPEQIDDPRQVDIRADIYSLGCTLYYLLSGCVPFAGSTIFQKIARIQQSEPPALQDLRPNLPPGLADVVWQVMAKRPEERFQTPGEVAAALGPGDQGSSLSVVLAPAETAETMIAEGSQAPLLAENPATRPASRSFRKVTAPWFLG